MGRARQRGKGKRVETRIDHAGEFSRSGDGPDAPAFY
jgi:hypothetical protein